MANQKRKEINVELPFKTLRPFQQWFIDKINTVRYMLLIAARQHGKTELAIQIFIRRGLEDKTKSSHVYAAPTLKQAKSIMWQRTKDALEPIKKWCVIRESDYTILLPNGAMLLLGGGDNEGLRGTSAKTLIIDEADGFDLEILNGTILPTTASHGDKALIIYIGTFAGGYSRLYDLYELNSKNPDWYCQITKASEAKILTVEILSMWKEILGEQLYQREFECDNKSPSGTSILGDLIVKAEGEGRIDEFPENPIFPVHFAFDLGLRDACTVWVFQLIGGFIQFIQYREVTDVSLENIIVDLKGEFDHLRIGTIILPHDVRVREMSTAETRLSLFKDLEFGDHHYVLEKVPVVETITAARLNFYRAQFNVSGCRKGIERLRASEYVKDMKTDTVLNKIRHDESSHGLDAFRYAMAWIERENPVMDGKPFSIKSKIGRVKRLWGD